MKEHKCFNNKNINVFIRKYANNWELEIAEILNTFSEHVEITYCPFCSEELDKDKPNYKSWNEIISKDKEGKHPW